MQLCPYGIITGKRLIVAMEWKSYAKPLLRNENGCKKASNDRKYSGIGGAKVIALFTWGVKILTKKGSDPDV
jgi:hypothetical protein